MILILVSSLTLKYCSSWQIYYRSRNYLIEKPRKLYYSVFASGYDGLNKYIFIHTYIHTHTHTHTHTRTHTRAVHKQTKSQKNASGSCHNGPPLIEWCLINRRLAATEWRYLSHFYWAIVTVLLLSTSVFLLPAPSLGHIHTGIFLLILYKYNVIDESNNKGIKLSSEKETNLLTVFWEGNS